MVKSALKASEAPQHGGARADGVIVVGGGIAGIAAALRLAERGVRVRLFETRRKLGGRATSFDDVRSGERLDNCQHITMGCCTNFLDLLARLGVADKIAWFSEIHWIEAGGRRSVLRPGSTPAPVHFAGSFLRARFLTVEEKLAIAHGMHAMARLDAGRLEAVTFTQWLRRMEQPRGAIEKFWAPVVVSACNLWPERLVASEAAHVFQEGFLAHRDAARMGVPTTPLVELYDAAENAISHAGGELHLGASAVRVDAHEVELADGSTLRADAVICATPFERAAKLASDRVRRIDPRFRRMERLEHSPILGVHLIFDRPVLTLPQAALVNRGVQWIFRKDDAGARIHAVMSGADDWIPLTEAEIVQRVVADIHACLPESRGATLIAGRPVKEKRATFAPTPESIGLRPTTTGPSGVILAGDYVQTGWPSTMEGATRSGYLAAAAALGEPASEALAPWLPEAGLYRAARAVARVIGSN